VIERARVIERERRGVGASERESMSGTRTVVRGIADRIDSSQAHKKKGEGEGRAGRGRRASERSNGSTGTRMQEKEKLPGVRIVLRDI